MLHILRFELKQLLATRLFWWVGAILITSISFAVYNGKIAIEKIKNKTYDIVLMDLQMPEMNGFEATEYIRNTLKSEIPIIALTADVTTTDLTKCKAIGMNDYLAKPLDDKLLYNKILNLVKKNGSTEYVKVKK